MFGILRGRGLEKSQDLRFRVKSHFGQMGLGFRVVPKTMAPIGYGLYCGT